MSSQFIVEGGLSIPSGKKLTLGGNDIIDTSGAFDLPLTLDVTGLATLSAGATLPTNQYITLASQPSLANHAANKAYVDAQLGASDLDIVIGSDSYGIDLDSETVTWAGTSNEVDVSSSDDGSGNITITYGLPASVDIATDLEVATLDFATGSIKDSTGAISFDDENLSTTGTLAAGATTVTGTVNASGTITGATGSKFGTLTVADGSLTDTSGAIDFGDENLTMGGTITVGQDDTGYDVKFFGATAGKYMLWDESADSLDVVGELDVNGTANLDAVDIDGNTQADGTITVGQDDTGYDVKFFGATSGKYMLWDEDADSLDIVGELDVNGTANLDAVDIDGNTQADGTITVGADDTGYDVKFYGATSGKYMLWDEDADSLDIVGELDVNGTANLDAVDIDGNTQADGTITVGADDTGYDVKFYGATSGKAMLWDEDADTLDIDGVLNVSDASTFQSTVTMLSGSTLSSDSADAVTSAAHIANKAYVDSKVTDQDLDFQADTGGALSIDLDSETLSVVGTANEIETAGSGNQIQIGLPDSVTIGDALTVTGLATMNGSVDLGDANTDTVSFNARIDSNVEPSSDSANDLGSSSLRWANLHVDSIAGGADEMVISADGNENSASGNEANSLSLNASGGIFTDADVDIDGTLDVQGTVNCSAVATFSSGYEMSRSKKNDFIKASANGSAETVITCAKSDYKSVKIHAQVNNSTDFTSKEVLLVHNGSSVSLVEYATVSTGTERDMTWSGTINGDNLEVKVTATNGDTIKGTYELLA